MLPHSVAHCLPGSDSLEDEGSFVTSCDWVEAPEGVTVHEGPGVFWFVLFGSHSWAWSEYVIEHKDCCADCGDYDIQGKCGGRLAGLKLFGDDEVTVEGPDVRGCSIECTAVSVNTRAPVVGVNCGDFVQGLVFGDSHL